MHTGVLERVDTGMEIAVFHEVDPDNGDYEKVATNWTAREEETVRKMGYRAEDEE